MLQNNSVTLCGIVMPGKTENFVSAQGHQILSFDLRTREVWALKDRDVNHFEYHKVTLKDAGNYRTLSRYAHLVSAGNKLLIQGKLRYKIMKDGNTIRRYPEIEASAVDLLAIVDESDLVDLNPGEFRPGTGEGQQQAAADVRRGGEGSRYADKEARVC